MLVVVTVVAGNAPCLFQQGLERREMVPPGRLRPGALGGRHGALLGRQRLRPARRRHDDRAQHAGHGGRAAEGTGSPRGRTVARRARRRGGPPAAVLNGGSGRSSRRSGLAASDSPRRGAEQQHRDGAAAACGAAAPRRGPHPDPTGHQSLPPGASPYGGGGTLGRGEAEPVPVRKTTRRPGRARSEERGEGQGIVFPQEQELRTTGDEIQPGHSQAGDERHVMTPPAKAGGCSAHQGYCPDYGLTAPSGPVSPGEDGCTNVRLLETLYLPREFGGRTRRTFPLSRCDLVGCPPESVAAPERPT